MIAKANKLALKLYDRGVTTSRVVDRVNLKHSCYLDMLEELDISCHIRKAQNSIYYYLIIGPYSL